MQRVRIMAFTVPGTCLLLACPSSMHGRTSLMRNFHDGTGSHAFMSPMLQTFLLLSHYPNIPPSEQPLLNSIFPEGFGYDQSHPSTSQCEFRATCSCSLASPTLLNHKVQSTDHHAWRVASSFTQSLKGVWVGTVYTTIKCKRLPPLSPVTILD